MTSLTELEHDANIAANDSCISNTGNSSIIISIKQTESFRSPAEFEQNKYNDTESDSQSTTSNSSTNDSITRSSQRRAGVVLPHSLQNLKKAKSFAVRLYHLLNCESTFEIIRWLPDGNGFFIINVNRFISQVAPVYFKRE